MAVKINEVEKIQKLKEGGVSIYKTAKRLKLSYNTVKKYWEYSPPPKPEEKPEPLPETFPPINMPCPNCQTVLMFLKTDKKIQCPNCGKIFNVIIDDGKVMRDKPLGTFKFPVYPDMWTR